MILIKLWPRSLRTTGELDVWNRRSRLIDIQVVAAVVNPILINVSFERVDEVSSVRAMLSTFWLVEKRKISYFVLARYLIQHWISPNQDDLSHSARTFISGWQKGWAAKHTLSSAWDGDQNGRVSGRPCLAMLFS